MTPAIEAAKKAGIVYQVHEYQHDPDCESYGLEAAHKLGRPVEQVFKTLLVSLNGDNKALAVAVVPVNAQLDLKAMAKACASKKASMADPAVAQRVTGYLLGGISPLGQKRRLPTILDQDAWSFPTILVSAGRRGMDIELSADDLCRLCGCGRAKVARR